MKYQSRFIEPDFSSCCFARIEAGSRLLSRTILEWGYPTGRRILVGIWCGESQGRSQESHKFGECWPTQAKTLKVIPHFYLYMVLFLCTVRSPSKVVLLLSVQPLLDQCLLKLHSTHITDFPTYLPQAPANDCSNFIYLFWEGVGYIWVSLVAQW